MSSRMSCQRCCILLVGIMLTFSGIIVTMIGFILKLHTRSAQTGCCKRRSSSYIDVENCRIAGPTLIVLGLFISAAMCCRGKDKIAKAGVTVSENGSVVAYSAMGHVSVDGQHFQCNSDTMDTRVSCQTHSLTACPFEREMTSIHLSQSFFPIKKQQAYPGLPLVPQTLSGNKEFELQRLSGLDGVISKDMSSDGKDSPPPPSYATVITRQMDATEPRGALW